MVELPTAPASDCSDVIVCHYMNATNQIQMVRIPSLTNGHCSERMIFPSERILFEAEPTAVLEVYQGADIDTQPEQIPCVRLQMTERSCQYSTVQNDVDEDEA
ncbi:MAG: DUF1830 domain-containing protein [Scytolyngbya sp. HA4215-MV1]|nr:DUF1830 domain-containing protein [Scytolyngbya sp. HA4215-MV1]